MIKIYTYSHNRPDFIAHQYASMKKYIKDDFEFIVFNNEREGSSSGYSPERVVEIFKVCEELGIKCIRVELDPELQFINGYPQFHGDSFMGNGSHACGYAFSWGWKHHISKNDCISMIIHSDMFFIKDISISESMNGYNFAYSPHYRSSYHYRSMEDRGDFVLKYPWNGIIIADIPNMPNPEELGWGLGIFNGQAADVGGQGSIYLEKYKNQLKEKYIDMVCLQRDIKVEGDPHSVSDETIEVGLNGCYALHVNFSHDENTIIPFEEKSAVKIMGAQDSDVRALPHQIERSNFWEYLRRSFQYIIDNFSVKHEFPKPTFIDLIKFETDDIEDAFIFHYKNASNDHCWQNEQYNQSKTKSLHKVLNEYIYEEKV